jgi:hypothetical protein
LACSEKPSRRAHRRFSPSTTAAAVRSSPHGLAGAPTGGDELLDGGGRVTGQQRHLLGHRIASAGLLRQAAAARLRECRIDTIDAGITVSWRASDISDPRSELHERHAVGVHAHDGYFSIDTGKFTCAPLFAARLLDQL